MVVAAASRAPQWSSWRSCIMDDALFDGLSRSLASSGSRRTILTVLATSALTGFRDRAEAKRKKKKKKKPKPAPPLAAPPPAHTVPPCIPDNRTPCAGKQCGPAVNSCGEPITCGGCIAPATCQNGQCICSPNCTGKQCGADGCDGLCGTCDPGETCSANGLCNCVPNCITGQECGPDGCGGSCGTCIGPATCRNGQCCTPNCTGEECGPDGCGGTCGTCGAGTVCHQSGRCVSACGIGSTICPAANDAGCCDTRFLVCCPGGMGCCSKDFSVCCPELNRCCPNGSQCGTSQDNPCLTGSAGLQLEAQARGIGPVPRRQRSHARPDERHTTARSHARRHGR
jgi:hypothetical protein